MAKKHQPTINISYKTIFFILILILGIGFLKQISGILIGLFISFLLVIAISPLVDWLEKKRIPRSFSSFFVLFLIFMFITGAIASAIGPLISQTQVLLQRLPGLVEQLAPYKLEVSSFIPDISSNATSVIRFAVDTFSNLIIFTTFVVVSFYLLQDKPQWDHYLSLFFAKNHRIYQAILSQIEIKLGAWIRGITFLMVIVGLLNYLGFILIGLPYALPLALIAGVLEIVPSLGPNIAGLLAAIVGFSVSPALGFLSILVAIISQQLENNLFVPKIMQKTVGIHPVITIVSLLVGFSLGGVLLAILSLPLVITAQVILSHLHYNKKTHNTSIK